MEYNDQFVVFEENRRIRYRGDLMKRWNGTAVFMATDKGTRVTEIVDYELPYSVIGKLMYVLKVRKDLESSAEGIWKKAKETLEER